MHKPAFLEIWLFLKTIHHISTDSHTLDHTPPWKEKSNAYVSIILVFLLSVPTTTAPLRYQLIPIKFIDAFLGYMYCRAIMAANPLVVATFFMTMYKYV